MLEILLYLYNTFVQSIDTCIFEILLNLQDAFVSLSAGMAE